MEYSLIIIPIIVVFATQILKLSIDGIKGNFNLKNIFLVYGGMPSAHAALVTSLTTMVALVTGFKSVTFAIALIFSFIIIRDAFTIRKYLGDQGKIVNELAKKLSKPDQKKYPSLPTQVGHTVLEVLMGIIWGFALTIVLYWIF